MSSSGFQRPSQPLKSVMVNGTLYEGERFERYCRQSGMCTNCGLVQTHMVKITHFGMGRELVAIKKAENSNGEYSVYKGFCLQPTCYTLKQVKTILGERGRRTKSYSNTASDLGGGTSAGQPNNNNNITRHPFVQGEHQDSENSEATPAHMGRRRSSTFGSSLDRLPSPREDKERVFLEEFVWNVPQPLPLVDENLSEEAKAGWEQMKVLQELQEATDAQDFVGFLQTFDARHTHLEIAKKAMGMLRKMVGRAHGTELRKYVFPGDAWVKIVKSTAEANSKDSELQEEIILTLWYLCSLNEHYRREVIRYDCIAIMLAALDLGVPAVDTMCCGALECLTRDMEDNVCWAKHEQCASSGLELMYERCVGAAQAMASIIEQDGRGGKELALSTLCNLVYQADRVDDFTSLSEEIHPTNEWLQTFVLLLISETVDECIVDDALAVLWRLSIEYSASSGPNPFCAVEEKLISAVSTCMGRCKSDQLQEAAYGLISNLLVHETDDHGPIDISPGTVYSLLNRILNLFSDPHIEGSLLSSGLHVLSNILRDSNRRGFIGDIESICRDVTRLATEGMQNVEVQRAACRIFAYVYSDNRVPMGDDVTGEGVGMVFRALDTIMEDDSEEAVCLRDEAYTALGFMAVKRSTAFMIRDSGIAMVCRADLKRSSKLTEAQERLITSLMLTTRKAQLEDPETDVAHGGIIDLVLEGFSSIDSFQRRNLLLASLHDMCSESEEAVNVFLGAVDGSGMDIVMGIMNLSKDDATVQTYCCGLLANTYARLRFKGKFDVPIELNGESGRLFVTPQMASGVKVLRQALKMHQSNPLVSAFSCLALLNFISGKDGEAGFDWKPDDAVRLAFSGAFKDVVDVLSIHDTHRDSTVQVGIKINAFRLARTLVYVLDDSERIRWTPHLLDKMMDEMTKRLRSAGLIKSCTDLLLSLLDGHIDEGSLLDIASSNGTRALYICLSSKKETTVAGLLHVTSRVLQRIFTFSGEIVEHRKFLPRILEQMGEFGGSEIVQAEACSVLGALGMLGENWLRRDISLLGGVNQIILAIQRHRADIRVQSCACSALAGIAEEIPHEVLLPCMETMCEELLFSCSTYRDYEYIQVSTLETLASLCAVEKEVSGIATGFGFVGRTVQCMQAHVPSERVQKAGCAVLRTICLYGDNRQKIGSSGGIGAIVVAILSHVSSSSLVKEAMSALKNLCSLSENKEAVTVYDGTAAIRLGMWTHISEPSVLSIGLSALNNISVNPETRDVLPVTDELLECILTAMELHRSDVSVQRTSCFLLKSYTFNRTSLQMMMARFQRIAELLMYSTTNFPDECEVRCQAIMRKLEGSN